MSVCAASPPVASSLRASGSARLANPGIPHSPAPSASIFPRYKLHRRASKTSCLLLGSQTSVCFRGAACAILSNPCKSRLATPSANDRRARGPVRASIDAFVIGFEGTLVDPSAQRLLEPAAEALKSTSLPFYILTSSSSSPSYSALSPADVSALLARDAGVDIPQDSPRIIVAGGGGDGGNGGEAEGKLAALLSVNSRPLAQDPANTMHYIDADLASLNLAAGQPELATWQLYHAQWSGSVGNEEAINPRIKPITLKDLQELLRWGLLMGVNDGCQEYEDGTPAT